MKSFFQLFFGFLLVLMLFLGNSLGAVSAAPDLLNPRINRLESQLRSLQSQVARIQSQVSRTSNSQSAPHTPAPEEPSFDQQFDTLAVLLIELQERVSLLEAKLEMVEESPE